VALGVILFAAVLLTAALAHRARLGLLKRSLLVSEPARTTRNPLRRVKPPRAGSTKAVASGNVYVLNPVCGAAATPCALAAAAFVGAAPRPPL
jgi:hypothetical protein